MIVGYAPDGHAGGARRATLWENGTARSLGTIAPDDQTSEANGVSGNGHFVVGMATDQGGSPRAFRWNRRDNVMMSVEDWLRMTGVPVVGSVTVLAHAVSDDGTVVVGELTTGNGFVARAGSAGLGSGLIDVHNYTLSVINSAGPLPGITGVSMVMHGAHGSPLDLQPAAGQSLASMTGDLGVDQASDGWQGMVSGEVAIAHHDDTALTLRLALGSLGLSNRPLTGGEVRQAGLYAMPEVSVALQPDLFLSMGLFGETNRVDSHRGYLNGGFLDYSDGASDGYTLAGRLRLDWRNAFAAGPFSLSPYASWTTGIAHQDSFVEQGGGFPAAFDAHDERFNMLLAGMDGRLQLDETLALTGRLELGYRPESRSASVSGTVIGLNSFDFAGPALSQVWGRVGLGFEGRLSSGTLSMMANATTSGSEPAFWLSTRWTTKF